VAIVGTRHATIEGRAVAFELGRDLAAAGVCVLSGLALGIDGAAHTGALSSRDGEGWVGPVGVAASGVDVPYPRRHARLWEEVCDAGAVLSETLPGQPAQAWRFPSRNRVIAGLARMVVVVESHDAGGSLITAEAAMERGIDVRAVPGPVRSPASAGTNQLLYDGAGPVRHVRDVLDGLGVFLSEGGRSTGPDHSGPGGADGTARLSAECRAVLAAVGRRPTSVNQVVGASSMAVAAVARALDQLEAAGLVREDGGWWSMGGSSAPR
jgi:DNA processing protein